ncbi:MAG TPA: hypothetical protein VNX23_06835 [Bradyrhizobium sp.]|uniref:hypothetical protein n=1 Tax=Bradyrhizobium sp. TaxID=376 RepID=UPI002C5F33C7|nr:hypothetical protein [Bradyrhizobium sp.]HXB77112.1 hypothetical protein [Bradyrhizobium sp.]
MANELALIKNETALTHLAAVAAQAQEMRLLKFSKGNWLIGDDELSADRLFIAHVHQLAHGWVKFIDGKVADQRVGIVANGFVVTDRSELGDTDRGQWEREPSGAPRDPWSKQYYLPLEDARTGELFTFVTGSQGGNSAIGKLTNLFLRNARRGLPIVTLATDFYKHKQYGRVEVPEFSLKSWTGMFEERDHISDHFEDVSPLEDAPF